MISRNMTTDPYHWMGSRKSLHRVSLTNSNRRIAMAKEAITLLGVLMTIGFIVAIFAIGPCCLHYTVNFWLAYNHKPRAFGWGWSLLGIPFSEVAIPAAIITKIVSFFL